jgi:hypothetical protein
MVSTTSDSFGRGTTVGPVTGNSANPLENREYVPVGVGASAEARGEYERGARSPGGTHVTRNTVGASACRRVHHPLPCQLYAGAAPVSSEARRVHRLDVALGTLCGQDSAVA